MRQPIWVDGIKPQESGEPMAFARGPDYPSVRFEALTVAGIAAVAERTAYVTLSHRNLAALLGAIPALDMQRDPEVWQAFLKLREFLLKKED